MKTGLELELFQTLKEEQTNTNVNYYSKIFYKGTFYETELKDRYEIAQGDAILKALDLIKKQKIKEHNVI